jgi:hypothetical protein
MALKLKRSEGRRPRQNRPGVPPRCERQRTHTNPPSTLRVKRGKRGIKKG